MSITASRCSSLLFCAALTFASGCDDDDGDDGAETGSHATHGDHGDHGDHDDHSDHDGGESDGSDADTMLEWVEMPALVDGAVNASFMIQTMGELHVAELRACSGADVADCGLGEMGTFESVAAAAQDGMDHMRMGSMTLAAGDWTVVAYVHVGANPHVSDAVNVTVP